MEEVFDQFSGKNMLPLMDQAIMFTKREAWPKSLTKRMETVRWELDRDGGGLAERRNLFVHGLQLPRENGEVEMTMVRWKGDNRRHIVSLLDAFHLANRLSLLAEEVEGVFDDYGVWKFDIKKQAKRSQQVPAAKALSRLVRAKNIKRALKLIFANLRG